MGLYSPCNTKLRLDIFRASYIELPGRYPCALIRTERMLNTQFLRSTRKNLRPQSFLWHFVYFDRRSFSRKLKMNSILSVKRSSSRGFIHFTYHIRTRDNRTYYDTKSDHTHWNVFIKFIPFFQYNYAHDHVRYERSLKIKNFSMREALINDYSTKSDYLLLEISYAGA